MLKAYLSQNRTTGMLHGSVNHTTGELRGFVANPATQSFLLEVANSRGEDFALSCFSRGIRDAVFTGKLVIHCGSERLVIFRHPFRPLHRAESSDKAFLMRLLVLNCWWVSSCCAGIAIYSIVLFSKSQLSDWNSFAYMSFTWTLQRRVPWMILGFSAAFGPVGLSIVMAISWCERWKWHMHLNQEILLSFGVHILFVLYTLKAILLPPHPVHNWHDIDGPSLEHFRFRRRWYCIFYQGNDRFLTYLMDALWQAEKGHLESLKNLLCEPEQAEELLRVTSDLLNIEKAIAGQGQLCIGIDGHLTCAEAVEDSDSASARNICTLYET